MAMTSSSKGECSVELAANAQAHPPGGGEVERRATDKVKTRNLLKWLNNIAFYVALFEWGGNALGTLAFLWATVVMLGGFCSLLTRMDFWFSTVMVFMEGTRVFIRNDASLNQWLFGSTGAFRWNDFSFPRTLVEPIIGNMIALSSSAFISGLTPAFRQEIVASILKLAILVVISQMLSRLKGMVAIVIRVILLNVAIFSNTYFPIKSAAGVTKVKDSHPFGLVISIVGSFAGGILLGASLTYVLFYVLSKIPTGAKRLIKVIAALGLVCVPLFQLILVGTFYRIFSMGVALVLALLSSTSSEAPPSSLNQMRWRILDTILPILCYWSVTFPLPGISLMTSFIILFFVITAVLVGNLQIPVALLQVALSIMRLDSLLGHHHHHHRDYHTLPDGASPNLVPSIVVFFSLELCQGSSYILGILLDLFSLFRYRRPLVSALGLTEKEWGAKAVNLYYHQAYNTWKEKGLLSTEKEDKYTPPSLESLAIESLGCSPSEMQVVRLHVLDYYLEQEDSESKRSLITQIAEDATNIITKIIGIIRHLITNEENSTGDKERTKIRSSLSLCLEFVRKLAVTGGKIGTRFRRELLENPILLNSLERILYLEEEDRQPDLRKPAMNVITIMLALDESAIGQKIGNSKVVTENDGSLREAARKVLANLSIMSTEAAIVQAGKGHDFIKMLINMVEDDENISIAANLLNNLGAMSGDMPKNLGVQERPESTLRTVLAEKLELDSGAAARKLVENLVNTLKSERVVHSKYLRRVLVEVIIYIGESCPVYNKIFRENGAVDALDTLKGMLLESASMRELVDNANRLVMAAEATPIDTLST